MDHPAVSLDIQLREVLKNFPDVVLAVLFGSAARDALRTDSDVDIAVAAHRALSAEEKITLIEALAHKTGRAIDLVDLAHAPEPLLGQIVQHGKRIVGSDVEFGKLLCRHLIDSADFMPLVDRMLKERRQAWIGT